MIVTTSRYSSLETRKSALKIVRHFALDENHRTSKQDIRYLARGKKTIEQIASSARRNGDETVAIVEERGGKPHHIATIIVDAIGNWKWDKEILIGD